MINKCVDCQRVVTDKNVPLCESCYKVRMKDKILNEDRVVESSHASWF